MIDPQVMYLQQLLNGAGYTIASSGPGSPGNETSKFGSLTRDSVRRFQCAKNIVCSGDEYSTGYGFVGNRTRTALLNVASVPSNLTVAAAAPQATPAQNFPSTPSTNTDNTAKIASLEAQIAQYLKLASDLQTQVALLKASGQ
jgi:peptidoglycan hydrolase-like protein with peptidoglycan-binding domain